MQSQTLNFDSTKSTYILDPIDTIFNFSEPIKNIKRISLASIEIPIGFTNIRASNLSNIFTVTIASTTSTITLAPNNYSSIVTLLTDINTAFTALTLTNTPVFSLSNGKIVITLTNSATILISQTTLSRYVLGFSKLNGIGTGITAQNNYNLAYDVYINMYINNIPISNTTIHSQLCSFKIPFSGIGNTVYYLFNNNSFTQYLNISDDKYHLNYLKVSFYDRFNYQIMTNNGLDYSFSLLVEYNE